jgi:hypothetical protein
MKSAYRSIVVLFVIILVLASLLFVFFRRPLKTSLLSTSKSYASGVKGVVTLSPVCAGAGRLKEDCTKPYKAKIRIKTQTEYDSVKEVHSKDDGTFAVQLPPGVYMLEPVSPTANNIPYALPLPVVVNENKMTEVSIDYDTGIR